MSGKWIYSVSGEYGERLQNKYHKYRYLIPGLPSRDFACRPENQAITYRTTCLDNTLTLQTYLTGGLLINIGDSEDDNNGDTVYAGLLKTQHNFDLLINALTATIEYISTTEQVNQYTSEDSIWVDVQRDSLPVTVSTGTWVSAPSSVGSKYTLTEPLDVFYGRDTSKYIPIGVVTEMDSLTARIVTHGYVDNVFTNLAPNKTYYIAHSGGTIGLYSDINENDIYVPVLKSITSTSGIVDIRREYYNLIEGYSREIGISNPDSTLTSVYSGCTGCDPKPVLPLDIDETLIGNPIIASASTSSNQYYAKLIYDVNNLQLHQDAKYPQTNDSVLYIGSKSMYYVYTFNLRGISTPPRPKYTSNNLGFRNYTSILTLAEPHSVYTYINGIIYKKDLSNSGNGNHERVYTVNELRSSNANLSLAATRNGVMYIKTYNHLFAFNTSQSTLDWIVYSFAVKNSIHRRCIINDNIFLLQNGLSSGRGWYSRLHKIDIHNGQVIKTSDIENIHNNAPISVDNNRDIYCADSYNIRIINSDTLDVRYTENWDNIISQPWSSGSNYSVRNCICNDTDNNMYIIVRVSEYNNGLNYQHHIVSLTEELTFRWQYIAPKGEMHYYCNELIVGDNNTIYVVTGTGNVIAIDTIDGTELWQKDVTILNTQLTRNLPVVLSENGVLVFAIQKYIYQVQTNSRLCKSSWPMNGANPMYTYCVD